MLSKKTGKCICLESNLNVAANVSHDAVRLFTRLCVDASEKCHFLSQQSKDANISLLLSKQSSPIPMKVNLGESASGRTSSPTVPTHGLLSDDPARTGSPGIDLNKVFTRDGKSVSQQKEAHKKKQLKEQSVRAPRQKPVFKQNL